MGSFRVNLKKIIDDSYDIEIGYELFDKLIEDLQNGLVGDIRKFAVITDDTVKDLYAQKLNSLLQDNGYAANIISFPAGEKSKTRATKEYVEDTMLELGYRRDCCIIAVGLLAAADASVGGKTAVDTPLATNLIGIFNQPEKVYLDIATWKTLPKEQISSGLAETIKHACIADREFFHYISDNMDAIFAVDETVCEHIAEMNCKIKCEVVMQDERESGMREILNLGHTVGRAIETVSGYRLLHGQALAIGLMAEVKMAKKLGYCSDEDVALMQNILSRAKLPTAIPDYIDRETLVKKLYTDKKAKNGNLRFVFQEGIGKIKVFDNEQYAQVIPESLAREIIRAM